MRTWQSVLFVGFVCGSLAAGISSCSIAEPATDDPLTSEAVSPSSHQNVVVALKARFRVNLPKDIQGPSPFEMFGMAERAVLMPAQAERVEWVHDSFRPRFSPETTREIRHPATLKLPQKANGIFEVVDDDSGLAMGMKLVGASAESLGEDAGGYLVYPRGHESGADIVHRPLAIGTEDFIVFEQPPAKEEIVYELSLGNHVAGVRVVADVVELLDASGTPRLRMSSARVFDIDGVAHDMRLQVEGCRFDTDPRGPWGRPVVDPQSRMCTVRLGWENIAYPLVVDPSWTATGQMATGRYQFIAQLLNNGLPTDKVLVAGGVSGGSTVASAELWDPNTGTWSATGSMVGVGRYGHSAVRLPNGKILLTAGASGGTNSVANSEWYDPALGTWSATTGMLNTARFRHTMTLLNDGTVLAIGGLGPNGALTSMERFNPTTQLWSTIAPMSVGRVWHAATQLSNGKLLITGGANGATCADTMLNSTEILDLSTMTWTNGPVMNQRHGIHIASLLPNGQVLVAGGSVSGSSTCAAIATSERYDPNTNQWTLTSGPLATPRLLLDAVLWNGGVLIAGGADNLNGKDSAERYDPVLDQWSSTGTMNATRYGHTLTLLNNGRALATGGLGSNDRSADLFDAGTLTNGSACMVNTNCLSGFCVDGVCCQVSACTALDQCHDAGTCQAGTGQCSNPNKMNGSSCNDNDACTQSDTCQAGACTGANPVMCSALDQCHDAGTCNSATGICSNPNKADGSSCNDNDACTQADTCQAGVCAAGTPVTCTALDQCHDAGTCNSVTGMCDNPNKMDGSSCNDNDACTQSDTCQAGACTGANPVTCNALDQCHDAGTCNSATGMCDNPNKADGSSCNDDDACTQSDTCQAGACTGANPVTCSALDQCHDAGTCDAATGMCDNPNKADGSSCNDDDACTQADTCQAGACTGANPVTCSALDQCHDIGKCDTKTGMCDNPNKADGSSCTVPTDGSTGTCNAGTCTADTTTCTSNTECPDLFECVSGQCQPVNPGPIDTDSGCSCSIPGDRESSSYASLALVALGAFFARRKRA